MQEMNSKHCHTLRSRRTVIKKTNGPNPSGTPPPRPGKRPPRYTYAIHRDRPPCQATHVVRSKVTEVDTSRTSTTRRRVHGFTVVVPAFRFPVFVSRAPPRTPDPPLDMPLELDLPTEGWPRAAGFFHIDLSGSEVVSLVTLLEESL